MNFVTILFTHISAIISLMVARKSTIKSIIRLPPKSNLLTPLYLKSVNNSTIESEVSVMYYTQEQIDRANQADLASFLQGQGEQLIPHRKRIPLEAA